MTEFDLSKYIEDRGMAALAPLLQDYAEGGHFVILNKGPLVPMLQATVGDVMLNRNGFAWGLELKTENKHTGNLFLETWSNRKFALTNGADRKPGWMFTLKADILWYYFLDCGRLYSFNFRKLWEWAHVKTSVRVPDGNGRMYDFAEKEQSKTAQMNISCGRCVPLSVLRVEVGYTLYQPSRSFEPIEEKDNG